MTWLTSLTQRRLITQYFANSYFGNTYYAHMSIIILCGWKPNRPQDALVLSECSTHEPTTWQYFKKKEGLRPDTLFLSVTGGKPPVLLIVNSEPILLWFSTSFCRKEERFVRDILLYSHLSLPSRILLQADTLTLRYSTWVSDKHTHLESEIVLVQYW